MEQRKLFSISLIRHIENTPPSHAALYVQGHVANLVTDAMPGVLEVGEGRDFRGGDTVEFFVRLDALALSPEAAVAAIERYLINETSMLRTDPQPADAEADPQPADAETGAPDVAAEAEPQPSAATEA